MHYYNRLRKPWLFGAAYLIATFALLPRLDGFDYFPGKYLWAEDGNIFLNQQASLGWSAIITPYAGYLHIYPRLIAAVAQFFELTTQPAILIGGWYFSYLVLIYAVANFAYTNQLSIFSTLALIILIAAQPNTGEVFFNITNSQWMIGAALVVMVINPKTSKTGTSALMPVIIFVLALTGPFSIILSPFLIFKLWSRRDWNSHYYIYAPVFIGAIVQTLILMTSGRLSIIWFSRGYFGWDTQPIMYTMFSFSLLILVVTISIVLVFIILPIGISFLERRGSAINHSSSFLLLLAAGIIIVAGLASHSQTFSEMFSRWTERQYSWEPNRYAWIPITLILISIFILTKDRPFLQYGFILVIATIFLLSFHPVRSPNLQFSSYARFSSLKEVIIPIHPQLENFPGWHVAGSPQIRPTNSDRVITLAAEDAASPILDILVVTRQQQGGGSGKDEGSSPGIVRAYCSGSTHAALEIRLTRSNEGWMRLFWSADDFFPEELSLRRWYPSGDIKAQFAFKLFPSSTRIRFLTRDDLGLSTINGVELFCMD